MSKLAFFKGAVAAVAVAFSVGAADAATYTYVGSWTVDQGAYWGSDTVAYTGQGAAALIFGGSASDYAISTISALVSDINFKNWVSVWYAGSFADCSGYPCGRVVAQDFSTSTGGLYLNPGDTSAYVRDWAVGDQFRNYAFKVAEVPVPAGGVLLLAALGGVAALRRRNKAL